MFGFVDIKVFVLAKILTPLFQMLFFCYLAKFVYHTDDMTPWVIGNAFIVCVYSVFLGAGLTMMLERNFGTLKMIIAMPTNRFMIFFSRSLIHIFDASCTVIIGLIVGKLVYNVNFSKIPMLTFALIIFIAMFAAISLGMLVSSIGLIVRDISMVMNIGIMALVALSGANIPVEKLPWFLQKISYCLPVVRSIQASRLLSVNGYTPEITSLVLGEFFIGCIYLILGYFLYWALEYLARKHATLDMF
jgi:ABC-2 type transport system permease protein